MTEHVVSFDPNVVLLDIGLPGLDGYQVAQELRRRFAPEELMLVAVTGYGGEKDHSRATLAGFDHYLVKPVNLHALWGLLRARQERACLDVEISR